MKLEHQVCSLELAKRLKELGVKQDSYATYFLSHVNGLSFVQLFSQDVYVIPPKDVEYFSAFTVAEVGEIISKGNGFFDSGSRNLGLNNWNCRFFEGSQISDTVHHSFDDKEADARAKMLIYLLENGIIKAEDINR